MAVVETVAADAAEGVVIQPPSSPPSSMTSQDSGVSSDDQNHHYRIDQVLLRFIEEQLAGLFVSCEQVVDCRICGDPTCKILIHLSVLNMF
ncbi:PREDICTED: polyadenylate-binding protein-interacting protein 11 isoform X4 [Camelina sativa]|uniref:Polyadenylate-binding protein-interacting protein 11 isoform X4 n=1 Tax=Camelina sativa TaxID=90675 RepID=A0ABM1RJB1_CAMSA|nr:PREDICTED: polyadenylate-binding protein-interacting protein 11 isoform X4 [Camelina sativa]